MFLTEDMFLLAAVVLFGKVWMYQLDARNNKQPSPFRFFTNTLTLLFFAVGGMHCLEGLFVPMRSISRLHISTAVLLVGMVCSLGVGSVSRFTIFTLRYTYLFRTRGMAPPQGPTATDPRNQEVPGAHRWVHYRERR